MLYMCFTANGLLLKMCNIAKSICISCTYKASVVLNQNFSSSINRLALLLYNMVTEITMHAAEWNYESERNWIIYDDQKRKG